MTSVPLEISNFFLSMQAGAAGAQSLEQRFAPDALYEEPFTGEMRKHRGRAQIMQAMAMGWENPMQDMQILIDEIATQGSEILVNWTCVSPSLPGGKASGLNRFSMENGLIVHLITTLEMSG